MTIKVFPNMIISRPHQQQRNPQERRDGAERKRANRVPPVDRHRRHGSRKKHEPQLERPVLDRFTVGTNAADENCDGETEKQQRWQRELKTGGTNGRTFFLGHGHGGVSSRCSLSKPPKSSRRLVLETAFFELRRGRASQTVRSQAEPGNECFFILAG
jgi:hypothetical protein